MPVLPGFPGQAFHRPPRSIHGQFGVSCFSARGWTLHASRPQRRRTFSSFPTQGKACRTPKLKGGNRHHVPRTVNTGIMSHCDLQGHETTLRTSYPRRLLSEISLYPEGRDTHTAAASRATIKSLHPRLRRLGLLTPRWTTRTFLGTRDAWHLRATHERTPIQYNACHARRVSSARTSTPTPGRLFAPR